MSKQPIVKMRPWSWHTSKGYEGQFARVERWYRRLRDADDPRDIEDYLYAFFQGCHHLREWLPEAEFPSNLIDTFIRDNVDLQICRDLANMTKHHSLTHKPATNAEPSIVRSYVSDSQGWFGPDATLVALTDVSDCPIDMLDLAGRCLKLWRDFLRNHEQKGPAVLP